MNENNKKQVSISEDLIREAKNHKLFKPGRGEGQGYTGLIALALSWALQDSNLDALTAYQNQFKLEALEAEKARIEAEMAELRPTKKGKK